MKHFGFTQEDHHKMFLGGFVAFDKDDNGILGVFADMNEFRKVYPSAEIVRTDWDYDTMMIWC